MNGFFLLLWVRSPWLPTIYLPLAPDHPIDPCLASCGGMRQKDALEEFRYTLPDGGLCGKDVLLVFCTGLAGRQPTFRASSTSEKNTQEYTPVRSTAKTRR